MGPVFYAFILPILLAILTLSACSPIGDYQPRDGDVIFQTSRSSQSQAIQLATKSPYSHMGIVYVGEGAEALVFEAVTACQTDSPRRVG